MGRKIHTGCFSSSCGKLLRKLKFNDCREHVENLKTYKNLEANVLKMHFLHFHLDFFLKIGETSDLSIKFKYSTFQDKKKRWRLRTVSSGHCTNGREIPGQIDSQYACWLLLDTDKCCFLSRLKKQTKLARKQWNIPYVPHLNKCTLKGKCQ